MRNTKPADQVRDGSGVSGLLRGGRKVLGGGKTGAVANTDLL